MQMIAAKRHLSGLARTFMMSLRHSKAAVWTADDVARLNQSGSPRDGGLGLETTRDRNSAVLVLVLKHWSRLFSRPINN